MGKNDIFWTFEKLEEFYSDHNIDYNDGKKKRGFENNKIEVKFNSVCNTLNIKRWFIRYPDYSCVEKNQCLSKEWTCGTCKKNESAEYIFCKNILCRIRSLPSKNEYEKLFQSNADENTMKQKIVEILGKKHSELIHLIPSNILREAVHQRCVFNYDKKILQSDCICSMYIDDECIPKLIIKLNQVINEYYKLREPSYSFHDIKQIGNLLVKLVPSVHSEEEYYYKMEKFVTEYLKEYSGSPTFSNLALNFGCSGRFDVEKLLEEIIENEYISQWNSVEGIKRFIGRYAKGTDFKQNTWRKEAFIRESCNWFIVWKEIFNRFILYKKAENEQGLYLDPGTILDCVRWEVNHITNDDLYFSCKKYSQEILEAYESARPAIDENGNEHGSKNNTDARSICKQIGGEYRKYCENLLDENSDLISEDDFKLITNEAFLDLERTIQYVALGWGNKENPQMDYIFKLVAMLAKV